MKSHSVAQRYIRIVTLRTTYSRRTGGSHLNQMRPTEKRIFAPKSSLTTEMYHRVLRFSPQVCSKFVLVIRPDIPLSPLGQSVLTDLQPHLIRREEASRWPGTALLKGSASVLYFGLNPNTLSVITSNAPHPFAWCQPSLPEDLSLLRADESPWLVTTAHEHDLYFSLTDEERASLVANTQLELVRQATDPTA